MNDRIWKYLVTLYTADVTKVDTTSLVRRYLDGATGDMNARMAALIAAAG